MKKYLFLLCVVLLSSCIAKKQDPVSFQGEDEITIPSIEEPTEPSQEEPTEPEVDFLFDDSLASRDYIGYSVMSYYDLLIKNNDGSLVYKCKVPYGEPMVTVEDSWKQLPHYSVTKYYQDGDHPGGNYKFDLYKFPVNDSYAVLAVRGSTDTNHTYNLKYVSYIEFKSGPKVNLEYSYLTYNGEYSNCIDYQCLDGNQLTGGSNTVIKTGYGFCTEFSVNIDGWIK